MNRPSTATDQTRERTRERPSLRGWLLFLSPVVLVAVVMAAGVTGDLQQTDAESPAPEFTLPTTTGEQIGLNDVLANGDAVVYFSMGIGCDGCFAQIPEIEDALDDLGITLVPVMVDPADALAREAARFGIESPILVDADRRVSDSYGMLGQFGHGDRPSHSFALVRSDGTTIRTLHYATMFVPPPTTARRPRPRDALNTDTTPPEETPVTRRSLPLVRPLLVVALLLAASTDDTTATTTDLTVVGTDDLRFEPDGYTIPADQPITLELTAESGVDHDFDIEDAGDLGTVDDDAAAGVRGDHDDAGHLHVAHADARMIVTTTFTIHESGTYTVFCDVAGHREAGMEATLAVTDGE